MNKLVKIALICAAAGIVLVGAAAVAVRVFLPPEKLKALAISAADKSLRRKLEVQAVDVGILTGVRIEGLRLSEVPDFSKGEFVKAERLVVSPEWLPLLSKEFKARQVSLEGAALSVVKGKDGQFNFSDLTGASATAPAAKSAAPAKAAAAAPLALAVNSLRLRDVVLKYADKKQGMKADLKVNDVEIQGFGLSGAFPVSADVSADYAVKGQKLSASLKAKGKVDLGGGDPSRLSADFRSFSLTSQGKTITGSLKAENAQSPKVSLALDVPALDSRFLSAFLGAAAAGMDLPPIKAQAELTYAAPSVDVSSFKVSAAGAELSGSASVADINAKDPKIKLDAGSNEFKLGPVMDILPQLRGKGLDGKASFKLSARGTASNPDIPKLEGSLALEPVSSASLKKLAAAAPDGFALPKTDVAVSAQAAGGSLTLKQLEVRLADLDAKVSGTVAGLKAKTQSFNLKVQTNKFQLASLANGVDSMKPFGLAGSIALNADVSGTAAKPQASGSLSIAGVGAKVQGQELSGVNGQVQFSGESVSMPGLTGKLNGSDFKLAVSAANPSAPTVKVSGWLAVLDLGALQKMGGGAPVPAAGPGGKPAAAPQAPAPAGPALKTTGDITVDKTKHPNFECGKTTLVWNLTGVTPDLKDLSGTAKLLVGPGKATSLLDFASAKGGFVSALVVPLKIVQSLNASGVIKANLPDVNNIDFNKIQGDYSASRGVISMQPFLMDAGSPLTLSTSGTIDMRQDALNLKGSLASSGLPAEIGKEVPFTVTGSLSSPSVRPDLAKTAQNAVKKAANDFLQKQGQQLLQNLFKH